MTRFCSLRLVAALFTFCLLAFAAAPASAGDRVRPPLPTESAYAAVLRTINPKLPLEKARAYARSVLADAWRTHLDPRFIMSIVTVESAWRSNALSRVGARGLGQLMPRTAAMLGVNAWNPADNLRGTSAYLKSLMDHFARQAERDELAIAGYNAGPKAVERYHGVPPYTETRNYVVRVLHVWKQLDARVGRAFAPGPRTLAVRPHAARRAPVADRRQRRAARDRRRGRRPPNPALSADAAAAPPAPAIADPAK